MKTMDENAFWRGSLTPGIETPLFNHPQPNVAASITSITHIQTVLSKKTVFLVPPDSI